MAMLNLLISFIEDRVYYTLSDVTFNGYRSGVIRDVSSDEGKNIWEEIRDQRYKFDHSSEVKREIGLISKQMLIDWYNRHIRGDPRTHAQLCYGRDTKRNFGKRKCITRARSRFELTGRRMKLRKHRLLCSKLRFSTGTISKNNKLI
ncbi:hypothetical protein EUTSA_v10009720mg [Eutrema salsugineum]|uniref:Uncharacterized protein n=1 Tax=Eutrema salsugineum TaxID=72664 RepID=V4L2P5_EUTSA|nr:hypothetical protein EUTSA_v10009720mg [Eutrema salsugineum]